MTVSLKDVAALAGVSSVAVSLALRDDPRISPARRRQIHSIAAEIGYRPNPLARAMRTNKSGTVGFLLPDLRTTSSNLKIEAIEQLMSRNGQQLLLGFTGGDSARLIEYIESMISRQVDGLIIFGPHSASDSSKSSSSKLWQQLKTRLDDRYKVMPAIILVDVQADTSDFFAQAAVDREKAMGVAVEYVASLGHTDLMYVGPFGSSSLQKWQGVVSAVQRSKPNLTRIRFGCLENIEIYDVASVAAAKKAFDKSKLGPKESNFLERVSQLADRLAALPQKDRPSCVLAASDFVAMALIGRLGDHGVQVPRDLSVVGFDGDDIARRVFRPTLTTLLQPQELLAERAVTRLMQLIGDSTLPAVTEMVEPTLAVGQSTALFTPSV